MFYRLVPLLASPIHPMFRAVTKEAQKYGTPLSVIGPVGIKRLGILRVWRGLMKYRPGSSALGCEGHLFFDCRLLPVSTILTPLKPWKMD